MKTTGMRAAVVGVIGLMGLLIGMGLHSADSQGVHVLPANGGIGRFQIAAAGTDQSQVAYFLDTKTGQMWMKHSPGGEWIRTASPVGGAR